MLPIFDYHPDPIRTGSVVASDAVCASCEQSRGYIYTVPVYAVEELDHALCPWCIADGSAHSRFEAQFVDFSGIGDYGSWVAILTVTKFGGLTPDKTLHLHLGVSCFRNNRAIS